MSCQEVRSMLSAYIDGEACDADAQFVAQHVAECASCAQEMEKLLRMTNLLRSNAEVEPPAGLLERLEAATVGRVGLLDRLLRGMAGVPRYARLAAAGLAAAAVLGGILISLIGEDRSRERMAGHPSRHSYQVEGVQDEGTRKPIVEIEPSVVRPSMVAARPTKRQMRRTHPASEARPQPTAPRDVAELPSTPAEEPIEEAARPEEEPTAPIVEIVELPAETEPEVAADTVVAQPPVASKEVTKPTVTPPKLVVQEDPSTMEELRARLAAKNKQAAKPKADPAQEKKHSITLVGFRF